MGSIYVNEKNESLKLFIQKPNSIPPLPNMYTVFSVLYQKFPYEGCFSRNDMVYQNVKKRIHNSLSNSIEFDAA